MKKKLRGPLKIILWLVLAYLIILFVPRPFNWLIRKSAIQPPAQESNAIVIVYEGTYPGFADIPTTAEQAEPGQKAMSALRAQGYAWTLPFVKPKDGGIAIYELTGCTPEYLAYWDGRYLWLPKSQEGPWWGYAPFSPRKLDKTLKSIFNK